MIYCFHEIGEEKNPYCLSKDKFKKTVEENPEAELHFDDGRKGILALEESYLKNIASRSTIFIVPNFVKGMVPDHEKYSDFLSYEDIEQLIEYGFEIGSHSLTHINLTVLPASTLKHELEFSKHWLESRFGIKITKFSYPYGKVIPHVQWEAEKIYKYCYTLDSIMGIKRKLVLSSGVK